MHNAGNPFWKSFEGYFGNRGGNFPIQQVQHLLAARHPNLPAKSFANGGVSIAMLEASSIDRNMSTRIFAFLRYII